MTPRLKSDDTLLFIIIHSAVLLGSLYVWLFKIRFPGFLLIAAFAGVFLIRHLLVLNNYQEVRFLNDHCILTKREFMKTFRLKMMYKDIRYFQLKPYEPDGFTDYIYYHVHIGRKNPFTNASTNGNVLCIQHKFNDIFVGEFASKKERAQLFHLLKKYVRL